MKIKEIISDVTKCPVCDSNQIGVFNSRTESGYLHRRRKCMSCGFRYSTYELSEFDIEKIIELTELVERLEKCIGKFRRKKK